MKEQLVRAATFLSDRRHFIGRFAATTAVVMTGGLGLRYRTAGQGVQGDVNTLVPGIKGRQHGITTYRVRQVDSGNVVRTDAALLAATGTVLGRAVRTREYSRELNPSGRAVRRVTREVNELTWLTETLVVDRRGPRFRVTYNGQPLGDVVLDAGAARRADPTVLAWTQQRQELLRLLSDINSDVDQMLPVSREIASAGLTFGPETVHAQTFCVPPQEVVCSDQHISCTEYAYTRSDACEQATSCAHSNCWNNYCTGCCHMHDDCDCGCIWDDFWCTCNRAGHLCDCV